MVDTIRPLEEVDTLPPEREERRPRPQGEREQPRGRASEPPLRREEPHPAPAPGGQAEQKLYVKLPSRDDPRLARIELILTMFPGRQQLVIWCEREKKRIGARCLIHEGLVLELQEMLGKENVVLK